MTTLQEEKVHCSRCRTKTKYYRRLRWVWRCSECGYLSLQGKKEHPMEKKRGRCSLCRTKTKHTRSLEWGWRCSECGYSKPDRAADPRMPAVRLKHDFSLRYDLSLAFFKLKNYREAETLVREILHDDPERAFQLSNLGIGATGNLGIALMNQGQMEEAEVCFRRNLGLVAPTYFNLGLMLFRTQRYTEALENFRRALELEPENPELHNLLGQTYDELGQPVEAEQSLRRAIEIDEIYALGYYDLGVILEKREGRKEEALAAFEQALKIDPDVECAYYRIACLHALSQKEGPALAFLKKALQKGFRDIAHIEKDSDWDGLRTNPKFSRLLEKYRETLKADHE